MTRNHARFGTLTLALTSAALLGACTPSDRAAVDSTFDKAGDVVAGAVDTMAGRIAGREYTNDELTGFINAYNDAEMEIGAMALKKATDPGVKAFAQRIINEHKALKAEVTKQATTLGLTPVMPKADESVHEDHHAAMRDLPAKAKGKEFDEAFVEHEIKMHKKVLDEVEDALGRNRNPEIRPLLEKARDGLKGHLQAAEELEKKFGA